VLEIGENVEEEPPELHAAAVVAGPVRVGAVVAVEQHLRLLVLAENDALLLRGFRDPEEPIL
jgi:hypothetical protein